MEARCTHALGRDQRVPKPLYMIHSRERTSTFAAWLFIYLFGKKEFFKIRSFPSEKGLNWEATRCCDSPVAVARFFFSQPRRNRVSLLPGVLGCSVHSGRRRLGKGKVKRTPRWPKLGYPEPPPSSPALFPQPTQHPAPSTVPTNFSLLLAQNRRLYPAGSEPPASSTLSTARNWVSKREGEPSESCQGRAGP